MKRIFAIALALFTVILMLTSCSSNEKYYDGKAIKVSVAHISGFNADEKYDLFFEDIEKGATHALPNGKANPSYRVDFTITKITKDEITISFSQPLDKINSDETKRWELEQSSFTLEAQNSVRFITPTDGGGDMFEFSLIDKASIPMK